jgi:hypothetical protein
MNAILLQVYVLYCPTPPRISKGLAPLPTTPVSMVGKCLFEASSLGPSLDLAPSTVLKFYTIIVPFLTFRIAEIETICIVITCTLTMTLPFSFFGVPSKFKIHSG